MISNDKHPKSGVFSVVISSISLLMLLIATHVGMTQSGNSGFSTFLDFVLLSMVFAIVGIISGLIGLRNPKKILPSMGILIGGIFFIIFIVVILF